MRLTVFKTKWFLRQTKLFSIDREAEKNPTKKNNKKIKIKIT